MKYPKFQGKRRFKLFGYIAYTFAPKHRGLLWQAFLRYGSGHKFWKIWY